MSFFSVFVQLGAMESDVSVRSVSVSDEEAKFLYSLVVGIYNACLSLNDGVIAYNKAPSSSKLKTMNYRVKLMQGRIERIAALGVHDFDFVYYQAAQGLLSLSTLFSVALAEYSILAKFYSSEFKSVLPDTLVENLEKIKQRIYMMQKDLGAIRKDPDL
jgi:hypothetical protein